MFDSKKIRINAADSWHQTSNNNATELSIPIDNSEFTLLRLNDDCLLHLYKFLDILDIINLSKTCDRLQELNEPIFQKCENFDLNKHSKAPLFDFSLSLMDVRTLLTNLGQYIRCLTINGSLLKSPNQSRYLDLIYRLCPQLNELRLHEIILVLHSNLNGHRKENNDYPTMKNLKTLELIKCDGIDDQYLMKKLGRSSQLTKLIIYRCDDISGKFFDVLKNMETINIQRCHQISTARIKQLLSSNVKTLTNVTILRTTLNYIQSNNMSMIEMFGGSIKNLKYLHTDIPLYDTICLKLTDAISDRNQINKLSNQLNNIEILSIPNASENVAPILNELCANNKIIEKLDISYKSFASNDLIEKNLLQLKTLKLLKLNDVQNMTSLFVIECAKELEQLSVLSCRKAKLSDTDVVKIVEFGKNLCELDVVGTNVTWNVIEKIADILVKFNDRPKLILKLSYFEAVNYNIVSILTVKLNNKQILYFCFLCRLNLMKSIKDIFK